MQRGCRSVQAVWLAATLLAVLAACVPQAPATAQPVTVKVVALPLIPVAPVFIAMEEGFYAEQGISIELVKMQRSSDAIPALAKGDVDVATASANIGYLNAMAREGGIKYASTLIYVKSGDCANNALVARRALVESGQLGDVAQVKGKRISVSKGNYEEYFLERVLASAGLTLDDAQLVDLPDAAEMEALQTGDIDIVSTTEPWVARIVASGHGVLWKGAPEVIPDFQLGFLVYGPNLLDKDPGLGERFMVATLKGVRQFLQGKTERNLEILAKVTGLEKSLLNQACWAAISETGHVNTARILDFQSWAVGKGLLDTPVPAEKLWDPRFVEFANKKLGSAAN